MTESKIPKHVYIDPKGLEAAVQAVRSLYLERLDNEIHSRQVDFSDYGEFFLGLKDESDRAMTVVGFTYIETCLRQLMAAALDPSVPGGVKKLFVANGPLSTVSACLKMARALGWLTAKTYNDLNLLRRIRNEAAHNHRPVLFDDDAFRHRLAEITPHEIPIARAVCFEYPIASRIQFRCRLAGTCGQMMNELIVAPTAIRIGMHPSDAFDRPFDTLPVYVSNLLRQRARAVLEILEQEMPEEFLRAMTKFEGLEGASPPDASKLKR